MSMVGILWKPFALTIMFLLGGGYFLNIFGPVGTGAAVINSVANSQAMQNSLTYAAAALLPIAQLISNISNPVLNRTAQMLVGLLTPVNPGVTIARAGFVGLLAGGYISYRFGILNNLILSRGAPLRQSIRFAFSAPLYLIRVIKFFLFR